MAEAAAEKAQTLAEQYFVKGDEEKPDLSAKTAEVKEVVVEQAAEATNVVSAAVAEKSSEDTPATEESIDATEENSGDEEAEEAEEFKLETAPMDFRFPTTNQTRHCFTRYIEYYRCTAARGEGAPECDKFAKYYRSLCPGEWIEKWNEQRENGTFPGPL